MLHLYANIKLIRLVVDKTQSEFGKLFGATKAMIVSYEKGKANPDDLFIKRLAKYAGVTIPQLKNQLLSEEDMRLEKVEKEDKEPTKNAPIPINENVSRLIRDLQESNIRLQARVTVLTTTLALAVSNQTGKSAAYVGSEIAEAIDKETDRLLVELRKKQSSQ